jgi:putative ABC transport system permease protein
MNFLSAIRVALSALLVNKGRSTLTSLGIIIGISAVIAMVSAGDGAREKLDERLENVGKNVILVRAGARTQQGTTIEYSPLRREDAEAIRRRCGSLLVGVAESQTTLRIASTSQNHIGTQIVGATPEIQKIRDWKVQPGGRFYTHDEVKKEAAVCLIGQTVRKKLFPGHDRPIGRMIRVDRVQLQVIGVLGEKGRSITGADQDNQVFMPITTVQRRIVGQEKIDIIICGVRSDQDIERAKQRIEQTMVEQHRIKERGVSPDFDVASVQEMAEVAVFMTNIMKMLTVIIASISLVVGGIGIMNIMLASVTERTREIGIRMAVGATAFDVLIQFLIEAVVLALIGGVLGVTLGILGAVVVAHVAGWEVVVSPGIVALAFLISGGVGVFFGYYPALKASQLDPIEALRYE